MSAPVLRNLKPLAIGLAVGLWLAAIAAAPGQSISIFAGTSEKGFSGDGQSALAAKLNDPTGIARGPEGELYICDTANQRIRKVSRDGVITTVAGRGGRGWNGDRGLATKADLNEPYEIRYRPDKKLVWVERLSNAVRQLDLETGIITTIAGDGDAGFFGDGGLAVRAKLNDPHSIAFDAQGNLYIADVRNHRIRKVDRATGIISTFAGNGEPQTTPDAAPFAAAPLNGPRALDFDAAGNLWVALREGNAIYKLDLTSGTAHHIAGNGKKGFAGNGGPAKEAALNGPKGISIAPNGDIYFADTENHAIRKIDAKTGTIAVVVGTGAKGSGPDGDPLKCQLARPHGILVDVQGTIFIGDSESHCVRVIRSANAPGRAAQLVPPRTFLLPAKHLAAIRQRVGDGDVTFEKSLAALKEDAEKALKVGPFSVTQKTNVPPSGDKHDYMSIAPYFWPDPTKSNGLPYIRRDGERNPANRTADRRDLGAMIDAVETLAQAWYFTGEEKYAARATKLLRVWLDDATRMNPNLQFGQAVPGINAGRGIGLIETVGLTGLVDAVGLLAGAQAWTEADQRGTQEWFAAFLKWMLESPHGRDEAAARNNHGTYYDVQVASFALFVGQFETARNVLTAARAKRIARQVEPDGRQPLELDRTRAWGYSTMNLRGLMSLAILGEHVGLDLWRYETPDGRSIRKALDYLTLFADGEKDWAHQQLGGWSAKELVTPLRWGALKYSDDRYRAVLQKISSDDPSERAQLLRPLP